VEAHAQMRRLVRFGATRLLVAGLLAAAIGCAATAAPTTPTPTTAATTTEVFSGTLSQLGSTTQVFTVAATGTVDISLTSVAPLATLALGVGVQTSDGTNCVTTITQNDNARSGASALKGTVSAGKYCVRLYDSGNIPASGSADYTIQVVHP
jgi:hypothetical protein